MAANQYFYPDANEFAIQLVKELFDRSINPYHAQTVMKSKKHFKLYLAAGFAFGLKSHNDLMKTVSELKQMFDSLEEFFGDDIPSVTWDKLFDMAHAKQFYTTEWNRIMQPEINMLNKLSLKMCQSATGSIIVTCSHLDALLLYEILLLVCELQVSCLPFRLFYPIVEKARLEKIKYDNC